MQLLPRTPRTTAATRRVEHIAELELILVRFWLPFGFRERKTNKKKRPNKPKPCSSIFLTLPAAAGTCLVSLGPKQTAPSCKATVGTSTAGTVSAGTAVPGLVAVLVVPGGGAQRVSSPSPAPHRGRSCPLNLHQHKSTTKPSSESCSSPGTSSEGSAEQEAMG